MPTHIPSTRTSDAYTRLRERRERNHLLSLAENLTSGEIRIMTMTPGQLDFLAQRTGNPLCELLGEALPDGGRRVALGPEQLDFLATLLRDDTHPVAQGMILILDLDERIVAGQAPVALTSQTPALVNTDVGHVLVDDQRPHGCSVEASQRFAPVTTRVGRRLVMHLRLILGRGPPRRDLAAT